MSSEDLSISDVEVVEAELTQRRGESNKPRANAPASRCRSRRRSNRLGYAEDSHGSKSSSRGRVAPGGRTSPKSKFTNTGWPSSAVMSTVPR